MLQKSGGKSIKNERELIGKIAIFLQACEDLEKTSGNPLLIEDLKKESIKIAKQANIKFNRKDFAIFDREFLIAGYLFHPKKDFIQRVCTLK